jgi:hypothetical protein
VVRHAHASVLTDAAEQPRSCLLVLGHRGRLLEGGAREPDLSVRRREGSGDEAVDGRVVHVRLVDDQLPVGAQPVARGRLAGVSAGQLPHGAEARGFERERLAPGQHLAQRDHVAE